MKLILEGEPKEIAALVLATQERRDPVVNITHQTSDVDITRQFAKDLAAQLSSSRICEW